MQTIRLHLYKITSSRPKLLALITAMVIAIMAVPVILPHITDTSTIYHTFKLPRIFTGYLNSPVGVAIDNNYNLWVTNHATNMFFMLNASNGKITTYATSKASHDLWS